MNNSITTIDKALVNGGVTDGNRTVFYKDVESVTVETTSRRPLRKNIIAFVSALFGGSVALLLLTIISRSPKFLYSEPFTFGFGVLFFVVVPFAVAFGSRTYFESVLRIATRSGVTKLVYTRSWHNPQEIGTAIAGILNQRRGQAPSPETEDLSYSLYINRNYKETPFFRLEENQLKIYSVWRSPHESGEDALTLEAEMDLTDVVSFDCLDRTGRYRNGFEGNSFWGKCLGNRDSGVQWDLVFTFRSGQKVTHYVRESYIWEGMTPIDPWEFGELMEALTKEMSAYLKSR